MKTRKLWFSLLTLLVLASPLTACGSARIPRAPSATPAPATTLPVTEAPATPAPPDPMAALVAAAQAEGMLTTIALPHDWCNYGEAIDTFKFKYGMEVNELDPDAGSGDQVEAIRANKNNTNLQAPDVIDVEFAFGSSLKKEKLIQPYKVSTWSTIPEEAKDPEGYWYGDYYWLTSFLVNTDVQPEVPQDWADLLDPRYKGQVALSGDPRTSNQAIQSVFAAALANGGSVDNANPGLDYFATLNRTGNLIPIISNSNLVALGKTPIRITWDYHALRAMEAFQGKPNAEVIIPASGRLANVFVQAISAYAPHPNAAKLWMEFLYSDEGQLLWMKGNCHPIREADLRAHRIVPEHLNAQVLEASGVVFPTVEQLDAAKLLIRDRWDTSVGADIQAGQ
jgi:putative spermidine/putrescine transport system substrate-binding protein